MENEKRKVGDYTVLCAVNIGSREIILAENEQSANGERFLCCYGERHCSLQSASRKMPSSFGQRLKNWIFPLRLSLR